MALPILRSSVSSMEATNVNTHGVLMPSTVNSGDLLLVFMSFDGAPTVTWDNTTAGTWTSYIDTANGANNKLVIRGKIATGTEDGLVLYILTSGVEQSVYRSVAYQNWEGTLAGGLNIPAAATGASGTPDPPAATDSWGSVERATIAVAGCDRRAFTGYPSTYDDNQFSDSSGGPAGCGLGSAKRGATEGSQNPGTFTIDSSDDWVAATVSIKGGTAAGTDYEFYKSDNEGITDSVRRQLDTIRRTSDTENLSDNVQRKLDTIRTDADNVGTTDSNVRRVTFQRYGIS